VLYLSPMNRKFILATVFFLLTFSAHAQDTFIKEMLESFASIRLWEYEEIPVDWKMKGEIQVDLNEGLNALVEGNYLMAEDNLSKALAKDSTTWQAYYYRAASRKQLRQLEFAEHDLLQVLRLHPKFPEAYMELAKIYHLIGKASASDSSINLAIANSKSKAAAYYVKGDINLILENRWEAVQSYSSCLEIDPNFHDARVKLTMSDFLSTYNVTVALQHLGKVLKKDSLQKTALLFRSIVNYDFNKKQSIRDLSSLIRVSPFNFLAYYFRGALYTEVKNFDKAFSDFQFIIKSTAANENYFSGQQTILDKKINLQNAGAYALTRIYGLPDEDSKKLKQAYCYLIIYNFPGSIEVINATSNPKEPLAVYLKAVANEHMGNHDAAYVLYDEALALDDQIADAYKKRGIYEQELEQWDKSIEDFNAVLKLTTDAFVIYKLRGISKFRLSRYKPAADDFSAYLKYDSTNKEVIGYRGMAYLRNGQMLEAYLDFAVSGNRQALNFSDMSRLVNNLLVKGDTLRSMNALNKFTIAAPNYTEGYVRKFKVHVARNEWSEIERGLPRAFNYSSALTAKSDESYLYTLQAMLQAKGGETEASLATFDRAILLDGKNKLASQEKNKLLATLGRAPEKTTVKNVAASKDQKKSAAEALLGDWTRAHAEFIDGSELPGNYYATQPQRFYFIKNKVITFQSCLTNYADYKLDGNKLQMGLQNFTVESVTNKELRLLETQTTYAVRHILIPSDSFTITRNFHYTVNRETADTVYTSTAGIEPLFKKDSFVQAVLAGITETVSFTFDYVVQKDGTIGEVTIITSTNPSLNKRFIQQVKKTSGNWTPGTIRGKPVNVKCSANVWRNRY